MSDDAATPRPLLLTLLPVRNGVDDLPDYLESVGRFADGVVALDDGSTDESRSLLEAHPLVHMILTNPARPDYRGWDDAANRQRLVDACEPWNPRWVLFLDADERIAPDDGVALRDFLQHDADVDDAFLLRHYRMVGDLEHYDRAGPWLGRIFAWRRGLHLPDGRLHAVPLPTAVPKARWRRTTIRLQHLSDSTAARRQARFDKYRESDPDHAYQAGYDHILVPPQHSRTWWPRPSTLAVLANEPVPEPAVSDSGAARPGDPAISVVVIAQDDEDEIAAVMVAATGQECPEPYEVIVVTSGTDGTAAIVREQFPEVTLIELDHPVFPGAARNLALEVARGRYLTCADSHVVLTPGALAAQLRAHHAGYALVTGTVQNGTTTWAGWASYFLDSPTVLPGRPAAQLAAPPVRCAFPVAALRELGGFPEDWRAASDTVVIEELFERGYSAWRDATTIMIHHSRCRTTGTLLRHHFARGRGMGRILVDEAVETGRFPSPRIRRFVPCNVPARLRYVSRLVWAYGADAHGTYLRAFPLVAAGAISWWLGACSEIARRWRSARRATTPRGSS